jgi:PIN domain nuclease of toxin-antitoxin system
MKYLLDTVVWIWSIASSERISREAREILENGEEEIYLSSVSSWEISIKVRTGKLSFPEPPLGHISRFMARQNLRPLSITHAHAQKVYDLPNHHNDPFDRMLIAQALVEDMAILTADRWFSKYPVQVVWCRT